jgi:hypothetical protein
MISSQLGKELWLDMVVWNSFDLVLGGGTLEILAATIILVVIWNVGFFLLFLFGCKGKFWAHWSTLQDVAIYYGNGLGTELALVILDFITDVIVFVLPIPMASHYPTPSRYLHTLTYCKDSEPSHGLTSKD